MAEGSSFAQAETALAGWLGRELGGLDDELQLEALEHLFVARDPRAFRGLDRFAAGASVVRRWLRAGAPPTETQSAQGRLFDYVVCQPRYAEGSTDVVGQGGGHCRTDTFFDFAFGSADGLERMVDLVAAVDDERFTEVVATHAPESLWSALEPHVAHWRVFAMHYARRAIPPSSIDEVWERFIPGRGLMLYVLATRHGRPGQGYWRTWGQRHAAPIAAAELASMLDAVPPSVAHVPWMRAAFGAWSLVDVLVPRLPVLADVPETPAALLHVAQELCRDGERADVLRLQQSVAATLRPKAAAESARFRPLLAYDCRSKPVVPFAHR